MSVWVDPQNLDFILAGSAAGGMFKTVDGGQNWVNVTDDMNLPGVGITSIQQDLTQPNVFYASTSINDATSVTENYGVGLIYSTDFGSSWTYLQETNTNNPSIQGKAVTNFIINPYNGNEFFAISYGKLFRSIDKGLSWLNISPESSINNSTTPYEEDMVLSDVEVAYNGMIFTTGISKAESNAQIWYSNDQGNSWTVLNNFPEAFGGFGFTRSSYLTNNGNFWTCSNGFVYSSSNSVFSQQVTSGVFYGVLNTGGSEYVEQTNLATTIPVNAGLVMRNSSLYIPKGVVFEVFYTNPTDGSNTEQLAYSSGVVMNNDLYIDQSQNLILNEQTQSYNGMRFKFTATNQYDGVTEAWIEKIWVQAFADDVNSKFLRLELDIPKNSNSVAICGDLSSSIPGASALYMTDLQSLTNINLVRLIESTYRPDANKMTLGLIDNQTLHVGGIRYYRIGLINNTYTNYSSAYNLHYDIRYMTVNDAGIINVANDGGISMSIDNGATWQSKNGNGLYANQFHDLDVSNITKGKWISGAQDGYTFFKNSTLNFLGGGDGHACGLDDKTDDPYYYSANWTLSRKLNGVQVTHSISNWMNPTPIAFHEDFHDILYYANDNALHKYTFSSDDDVVVHQNPYTSDNQLRYRSPKEIYWSKNNSNIILVGYFNVTWNGPINNVLYLSTDGGTSFQDITSTRLSAAADAAPITGITIDEENPNRIWVSMGGMWYGGPNNDPYSIGHNRVIYTDDSGANWTDLSDGLSAFPVLDIIRKQTANGDLLFAATDVGVYVKEGEADWKCFSTDLPKVPITKLKINECTQELYISTYGRGIWKTDISSFTVKDELITANTTYSSDQVFHTNLIVKSGKTLTLQNCTVSMSKGNRIVVEPGAKLVINESTITNTCGSFWQGIEVQGASDQPQTPQYQGMVLMQGNSVIEYAYEGMRTIGTNANGDMDWTKTGGIIRILGGEFKNCRRGIEFLSYHNFNPSSGAVINNISSIANCSFITSEELPGNVIPYCGISLYDVDNVTFSHLTFENQRADINTVPYYNRGNGIVTLNADVKLKPGLAGVTPQNRSTFKNLNYGVIISGTNGLSHSVIRENDFIGNEAAVFLNGSSMSEVLKNNIVLPTTTYNYAPRKAIGVLTDHATGYLVTENTITIDIPALSYPRAGFNKNTNITSGQFYKNTITNVSFGEQLEGDNSTFAIDCNSFDHQANSFIDIYHHEGFMENQGTGAQGATPRHNNFIGSCTPVFNTTNSEIYKESYNTNNWTYYAEQGTIDATCVDNGILVQFPPNAPTNQCPTQVIDLGIIPGVIRNDATAIATYNGEIQVLKNKLAAGDADNLLIAIQNQTAGTLKNTLMDASPYLTDRVLTAYLSKPQQEPQGHIQQVVIANSPVSQDVLNVIDHLNLSNGIYNLIMNAQTGIPPRQVAASQISSMTLEKTILVDKVVRAYLDTNWADSARIFLENEGSVESLSALIPMELSVDPVKTQTHLTVLLQEADRLALIKGSEEQAAELYGFCGFYQKLLSVSNRPGGLMSLIEEEKAVLRRYATGKTAIASNAQAILDFINQTMRAYDPANPTGGKSAVIEDNTDQNVQETQGRSRYFTVVPNPSDGNTLLKLVDYGEGCDGCYYTITDLTGKQIQKVRVRNQVSVNLSQLSEGIYIVRLQTADQIMETQKIVIQK